MSERNPRLPVIRIDAYAAKHLKLSLEKAMHCRGSGVWKKLRDFSSKVRNVCLMMRFRFLIWRAFYTN